MARPTKDREKVKVSVAVGITRWKLVAFDKKIKELELSSRSSVVESLIDEFLKP